MSWRCGDCDRTYDEPPETCVCGSANVVPDDDEGQSRYSMLAVRERLVNPKDADRSLIRDEPYVSLVFRLLFLAGVGLLLLLVTARVLL